MKISISDILCDRCGTIYGLTSEMEVAETTGHVAPVVYCTIEYCYGFIENRFTKRYNLCPDCRKAFEKFMKGGDKQ